MARLGSKKRPAIVRVKTMDRAGEIMSVCTAHGWQVIVGIEPDEPEDISDVQKLLGKSSSARPMPHQPRVSRNNPCPCGSGSKYKRCCGRER